MSSLTLRHATLTDADAIAEIHFATRERTYGALMPLAPLQGSTERFRRERIWHDALQQPQPGFFTFLAEEVGRPVGFVHGGLPKRDGDNVQLVDRYTAEILSIYLLPDHHGRGVGRLLLGTAAQWLQQQGHDNLFLWAARGNPAEEFYRRLGGVNIAEGIWNVEGYKLPKHAYGWTDLSVLTAYSLI